MIEFQHSSLILQHDFQPGDQFTVAVSDTSDFKVICIFSQSNTIMLVNSLIFDQFGGIFI